jgi:hypothetical protein
MAIVPAISQRKPVGVGHKQANAERPEVRSETTTFGGITAYSDGHGAVINWETLIERSSLGFNVYRLDRSGTHLVSDEVIGGSALLNGAEPVFGEKYSIFDPAGDADVAYVVENISVSGERLMSDTVAAERVDNLTPYLTGPGEIIGIDRLSVKQFILDAPLSLPKEVGTIVEENALVPDPETHKWVIMQPGVRIGVKADGLFRVTRAELQAGGFNVDTDPALWQLYERGVQQSIIVGGNGDYIEFIGGSIDTPETDERAYFLINGPTNGKRIPTRVARPNTGTVVLPNNSQTFTLKERTNYTNQIRNGDAENFWGRVITAANATTLNFELSGIDLSSPNAQLDLKFQGFSSGLHQVNITLNGQVLAPAVSAGQLAYTKSQTIPTSLLVEGQNSIVFQSASASNDSSLFDQINISFDRKFLADDGDLFFYTLNDKWANLTGLATNQVRMFDIGFESDPMEVINLGIVPDGDGFALSVPAARPSLFYVVESDSVRSAASIKSIGSDTLSLPTHSADLVIIAYKDFLAEAENWATYRRNQGFTVKVVEVSEIFEEFNYGVLSADSIKAFLNYADDNWTVGPQYVLLIGDATFDPRDYLNQGFFNFVPARIINTIFTETASDEFLADFNNNGLSEIAIGRIPVRDSATLANVRAKMERWESNLTDPLSRGALFAFDLPSGYDFEGMSGRLRDQLPKGTPSTMIFRGDPDPQVALLAAMNDGKYIVNYSGHGSTGTWAALSFFSNNNVLCIQGQTNCVNNVNDESVFTMLTCLNGFFHNLSANSLAESLVFLENKGAVAAWASTGLTTPDVQEVMGQRFYQQVGLGNITRLGDLIKDAKTQIPGGMDVRLSWALIGDPMLKMR